MRLAKWLLLGLLLLPLGEIAVFVLVSAILGVIPAFALLLAGSIAGALVLRRVGSGRLERLKVAAKKGDIPDIQASSGSLLGVLGGLLLLLPGFLTDILGILLLLPPVQRWIGRSLGRMIQRGTEPPGRPAVVDLDRGEWQQIAEPRLPPDRAARGGGKSGGIGASGSSEA
jgi:UPF0716 protein FxsA